MGSLQAGCATHKLLLAMEQVNFALSVLCMCLTLLSTSATETCDKSKCPGPIAYYESLSCLPVYNASDDCCAYKYNCDHLKTRSPDSCYRNGHEYTIGEKLREEDSNPCDIGCTCQKTSNAAAFNCAVVDCFFGPVKPGCYRKRAPTDCCPGEEVCPDNPEDRATCEVDGVIYRDGEYFEDKTQPDKNCICMPGYMGENVEPFCVAPKAPYCSPDFRHADDIINNCAPTYYSTQSPQTSCSVASRCQNDDDVIIPQNENADPPRPDDDMVCQFGTLLMHYGDELNQATDYSPVCIRCVCEVGPTPTCQRLPDNECDVTNHRPFNHSEE